MQKIKVKGHSVQKLECRWTDGWTEAIALPPTLTRSEINPIFMHWETIQLHLLNAEDDLLLKRAFSKYSNYILHFEVDKSKIIWIFSRTAFSALTLLVGRQEEHMTCKKTWVVWCWHGCVWVKRQILQMAEMMPLLITISFSNKSRLVLPSWLYLSGAGSPGWSRTKSKRVVKWLCVCVCFSGRRHM